MPRVPAPLPEGLPWPVFTRSEALASGLSRERLRRSDLTNLRRGLFRRRDQPLTELDLTLALCRENPEAVVAGLTAARLHTMQLPLHLETQDARLPVQVALPGGRKGSDCYVRWRNFRIADRDVEQRDFAAPVADGSWNLDIQSRLRLTNRPRTWRDLAPYLPSWRLVAIGDSLVRSPRPGLEKGRTDPCCTMETLRAQCTGRYARTLNRALDEVRIGSDSPMETLLRLAFRRAGLPTPVLNEPLSDDEGRKLHDPDFQWPEYKVCVEYDGGSHNSPEQVARDIRRSRRASQAGWTEIRLHSADIGEECDAAVALVTAALVKAGWVQGPRPTTTPLLGVAPLDYDGRASPHVG